MTHEILYGCVLAPLLLVSERIKQGVYPVIGEK